jgi:hypothetical protein
VGELGVIAHQAAQGGVSVVFYLRSVAAQVALILGRTEGDYVVGDGEDIADRQAPDEAVILHEDAGITPAACDKSAAPEKDIGTASKTVANSEGKWVLHVTEVGRPALAIDGK